MAGLVTAHHGASGYPTESGYVAGLVVLAGALCLAAIAALWVPDGREQATGGGNDAEENRRIEVATGRDYPVAGSRWRPDGGR